MAARVVPLLQRLLGCVTRWRQQVRRCVTGQPRRLWEPLRLRGHLRLCLMLWQRLMMLLLRL